MLDVFFFPISLGLLGMRVGLHGLGSWFPLGRADLTVLVGVLESLDKSDELFNISSDRKVVVGGMSEDALVVNDESCSRVSLCYLLATPAFGPLVMRHP